MRFHGTRPALERALRLAWRGHIAQHAPERRAGWRRGRRGPREEGYVVLRVGHAPMGPMLYVEVDDHGCWLRLPCRVAEAAPEGAAVTAPLRPLLRALRALAAEEVAGALDATGPLRLRAGAAVQEVPVRPAPAAPLPLPAPPAEALPWRLDGAEVIEGLQRVLPLAPWGQVRLEWTGVQLRCLARAPGRLALWRGAPWPEEARAWAGEGPWQLPLAWRAAGWLATGLAVVVDWWDLQLTLTGTVCQAWFAARAWGAWARVPLLAPPALASYARLLPAAHAWWTLVRREPLLLAAQAAVRGDPLRPVCLTLTDAGLAVAELVDGDWRTVRVLESTPSWDPPRAAVTVNGGDLLAALRALPDRTVGLWRGAAAGAPLQLMGGPLDRPTWCLLDDLGGA